MGEEIPVRLWMDHPDLSVWEDPESSVRIPAELMENIKAAWAAVERAKVDIARYLVDHSDEPMAREWLAQHEDDAGGIDGE